METAVPTGLPCTPKEERPRLINSAQSWDRVRNNKEGTLDSNKSGDSEGRSGLLASFKYRLGSSALETDEELLVDLSS